MQLTKEEKGLILRLLRELNIRHSPTKDLRLAERIKEKLKHGW